MIVPSGHSYQCLSLPSSVPRFTQHRKAMKHPMCSSRPPTRALGPAETACPSVLLERLGKISQRVRHLSRDLKVKNEEGLAGRAGVEHKSGWLRRNFQQVRGGAESKRL